MQARRERLQHRISDFVAAITLPPSDESLARWGSPICVKVSGMTRSRARYLVRRLSLIARQAHMAVDRPRCEPSFLVFETRHPQAFLQKLWDRNPTVFNEDRGIPPIQRFIEQDRPVRIWYNVYSSSAAGSRLRWETVRVIGSVVVAIDPARIRGVSRRQLADYVAMVGFAQIRDDADPHDAPTILRLFTSRPRARPRRLSRWDRGFLKALYDTDASSVAQVGEINRRMLHDLAPRR